MNEQLFKAPVGETGLFVAGGWHGVTVHPEHGPVLTMPAEGDYSSLRRLGYEPVPSLPPTPKVKNVATKGIPDAATPLQPRTQSA